MTNIVIANPAQIAILIDRLNRSDIFNHCGISAFSAETKYLKWYAPSLDYPGLLNSYYLYPPFRVTFGPHCSLTAAGETGESDFVLDSVKTKLLDIIFRLHRSTLPSKSSLL